MIQPGTLIDDRYQVLAVLGSGAFGTVIKARQLKFDRLVAIKLLKTTLLEEADGLLRFEREAIAINSLRHKNIVGFYGFGHWNNSPYMVMELIEGRGLDTIIAGGKLEPRRALNIMAQVFDALSFANRNAIVHRDLKPSNIMVARESPTSETVKIIDFGLAKLMPSYGIPGQKLTETGYALGTCHYMPPEQALGIPVDQRADIYSAGCILQEALTGRRPFDAPDNVALMFQHINDAPPPLVETLEQSEQTRALQIIIDNCLAKDPDDRYAEAAEASRDLIFAMKQQYQSINVRAATKPRKTSTSKLSTNSAITQTMMVAAATIAILFCLTWIYANKKMPSGGDSELENQQVLASAIEADVALAVRIQDKNRLRCKRLLESARSKLPNANVSQPTKSAIYLCLADSYSKDNEFRPYMEVCLEGLKVLPANDPTFFRLAMDYATAASESGQSDKGVQVAISSIRAMEEEYKKVPTKELSGQIGQLDGWLSSYYLHKGDKQKSRESALHGMKLLGADAPAYPGLVRLYGATARETQYTKDFLLHVKRLLGANNPALADFNAVHTLAEETILRHDLGTGKALLTNALNKAEYSSDNILYTRDLAMISALTGDRQGFKNAMNQVVKLLPESQIDADTVLLTPFIDPLDQHKVISVLEEFDAKHDRLPKEFRDKLLVKLANKYFEAGMLEKARLSVETKISTMDSKSSGYAQLAECYAKVGNAVSISGERESAKQCLKQLRIYITNMERVGNETLGKDCVLYLYYGDLVSRLEGNYKAVQCLNHALANYPQLVYYGHLLHNKAVFLSAMEKSREALAVRTESMKFRDMYTASAAELFDVHLQNAKDCLALSNLPQSREQLRLCLSVLASLPKEKRDNSDVERLVTLADVSARSAQDYSLSASALDEALKHYSSSPLRPYLWIFLAAQRMHLGDVQAARSSIQQAKREPGWKEYIANDPQFRLFPLLYDARENVVLNRAAAANAELKLLETLIAELKLDNPKTAIDARTEVAAIAHNYALLGNMAKARSVLSEGLSFKNSRNKQFIYLEMAKDELIHGDAQAASKLLKQATSLHEENTRKHLTSLPAQTEFHLECAAFCLKLKDFTQCKLQLEKLKPLASDASDLSLRICRYYGLVNAELLSRSAPLPQVLRQLESKSRASYSTDIDYWCAKQTQVSLYINTNNLTSAKQLLYDLYDKYKDLDSLTRLGDINRLLQSGNEWQRQYDRALAKDQGALSWIIWFAKLDNRALDSAKQILATDR